MQRKLYGNPQTAKDMITNQKELQNTNDKTIVANQMSVNSGKNNGSYTTVGFEFEFAQFADSENIMHNLTHVELGKTQVWKFTNLPFILETDAADAIELVTPPLIMETKPGVPLPLAEDVEKADKMFKASLTEVTGASIASDPHNPLVTGTLGLQNKNFDVMVQNLNSTLGLDFPYGDAGLAVTVKPQNVNLEINQSLLPIGKKKQLAYSEFWRDLIRLSQKGLGYDYKKASKGGISSQINFASSAEVYDMSKTIPLKGDLAKDPFIIEYKYFEDQYYNAIKKTVMN